MKKAKKRVGKREAALEAMGRRKRFPRELKLKIARLRIDEGVASKVLAKLSTGRLKCTTRGQVKVYHPVSCCLAG